MEQDGCSWLELQLAELLKELKPSYEQEHSADLQRVLKKIKSLVTGIEPIEPVDIEVAEKMLLEKGVVVPFRNLPANHEVLSRITVGFSQPSNFFIGGSWMLQSCCKPDLNVDFVAVMPDSLFKEKDYLNNRYFHTKVFYLSVIASALKSEFSVEFHRMNNHSEVLLLTDSSWNGFSIRIHAVCSPKAFSSPFRLSPEKSLLRKEYMGKSFLENQPSSHYNNSILAESTYRAQQEAFHSRLSNTLVDSLVLAKHWIRQCGSWITGFEFQSLLLYLVEHGVVGSRQSSLTIFQAALRFIANHNPKSILRMTNNIADGFSDDKFSACFDLNLIDHSGAVNLWSNVDIEGFKLLQSDAQKCLRLLELQERTGFEASFLVKRDFSVCFDAVFRLELPSLSHRFAHPVKAVSGVIKRSLGSRISGLSIRSTWHSSWALDDLPDNAQSHLLGILCSDSAFNLVDFGPSIQDDASAKQFRSFWGEKSELRKFKSGIIHECVVWEDLKNKRQHIIPEILSFALQKHISESCVITTVKNTYYTTIDASPKEELDALSKILKKLDLPLNIHQVIPISSGGIGTSAVSRSKKEVIPQIQYALLQLESSTVWPTKSDAVESTKTLYYHRVAAKLSELGMTADFTEKFVQVQRAGYTFRLAVTKTDGIHRSADGYAARLVEFPYIQSQANIDYAILASSFIGQFVHLSNFGAAARYIKSWLEAHLFYPVQLDDFTIDLLLCYLFSADSLYKTPSTVTASLEKFWSLLKYWDWALPLTIHAPAFEKNEMVKAGAGEDGQLAAILGPKFILVTSTSRHIVGVDCDSAVWKRLVRLSELCLDHLGKVKIRSLFSPSFEEFDAIFKLNDIEPMKQNSVVYSPVWAFIQFAQVQFSDHVLLFWNPNTPILGLFFKPNCPNRSLLVRELQTLGSGVISSVKTKDRKKSNAAIRK